MIKLYNTATRKLETFRPLDAGGVKVYTCGPTVYDTPHVGNFASYIYWDLLVRMLAANNYTVKRVLNLTDVGHLVSDGDEGEDKLEKGARKSGQTVWDVAEYYIGEFKRDFRRLRLAEPFAYVRATDYIEADMRLVDMLTEKGYTYETQDGIYFDTAKFPQYAEFARLDLEHMRAGARVEFSSEKRNLADFAVWKYIQPGEKHAMRWQYRGRDGYPGWHVECSTIIHEILGEPIDIHTGGIDHIPVHHTNEIAQSTAAYGRELARYWLHCDFLTIDGAKISKSLGNIYTIDDLVANGYAPLDFKMWVLQGHYQSERDFTLEGLAAAKQRRLNWRNRIARLIQASEAEPDNAEVWERVLAAVSDNLNSPKACAEIDAADNISMATWQKIEELFGLGLMEGQELTEGQAALLAERKVAKEQKEYGRADEIRAELARQDIQILDTANGQVWQHLA